MRRWPFQSSEQAPIEHFPVIEDLLRRNVEDIFRVERQEVRGLTFGWGGTLLVEPARALALIEPRFKPFGYTPFLGRLTELLDVTVPGYVAEGKAYLVIGVGCTGGRHRSVVVAEDLAEYFRSHELPVTVEHRDLDHE